jgi:very-short-patch-repair endonuclease
MEEKEKIEGIDYVTCKLCNRKMGAIQGSHLINTHKINSKQYKQMFPDAKMLPDNYKGGFRQSRGKHMKEEKYRKMFSEKFSGQNNRNSKSNTTEQERKERSPFAKEFYVKRSLSEEDRKHFNGIVSKNRIYTTQLEYYIKKGFSNEDASEMLKERQSTGRLDKFIKRYGEKEGLERWKSRQEKWLNNFPKNNYSLISQKLFNAVYEKIKDNFANIYYATKENNNINNEFRLKLNDRLILPDFYVAYIKKIIEFDGIYWHKKNPENIKREKHRDYSITSAGYDILHIREDDYHKNPEETIKKCINFIYA